MKHSLQTMYALASLIATLSFSLTGCSTSTGSSDTPTTPQTPVTPDTTNETPGGGTPTTPPTLTVFSSSIPTMTDLVGTWIYDTSNPAEDKKDADGDGDYDEVLGNFCEHFTRVITMTDPTHGTYIEVDKTMYDYPDAVGIADSIQYSARKGTITLTAGVITLAQTDWISPSATPLDVSTVSSATWQAYTYSNVDNCAIIDGKFFTEVYKRTGEGTGLEGTWSREMTVTTWNYRFTNTYAGTTFASTAQSGQSGTYGPTSTNTYTYAVTSATSMHIKNVSEDWDQTVYLGTDVVALPEKGHGWVKQ